MITARPAIGPLRWG
ncbi:unnamed protein product, partial [Rotaria sp. Silwood1]